jgi:hypothetical protein
MSISPAKSDPGGTGRTQALFTWNARSKTASNPDGTITNNYWLLMTECWIPVLSGDKAHLFPASATKTSTLGFL